jgi:hypothetical protein
MSFELSRPSRARRIALLDSLSIEIGADLFQAGADAWRLRHLDQLAALYVVAGMHGHLSYDRGAISALRYLTSIASRLTPSQPHRAAPLERDQDRAAADVGGVEAR